MFPFRRRASSDGVGSSTSGWASSMKQKLQRLNHVVHRLRANWYLVLGVLALVTVIYFKIQYSIGYSYAFDLNRVKLDTPAPIAQRLVHIDLKGMPPRAWYLRDLMPFLAKFGATGVLFEWEDMLPYTGEFEVLRSPNAYTIEEVREILSAAHDAGLAVVPLVPSFGHMEMLLKHRRFAHLREHADDLRSLCPSHPRSFSTVTALLEQILAMHPKVARLHIGGMNALTPPCVICQRTGAQPLDLYLIHITRIVTFLHERGVTAMLWDDGLRGRTSAELEPLADAGAELVVGDFSPDLRGGDPPLLKHIIWNTYEALFPGRVWGASAFRGADATDGDFVPALERARNAAHWLKLSTVTQLRGMVVAGPSRRDHLLPLCETLPAAIPALALNLAVLQGGIYNDPLRNETLARLGISSSIPLSPKRLRDVASWLSEDDMSETGSSSTSSSSSSSSSSSTLSSENGGASSSSVRIGSGQDNYRNEYWGEAAQRDAQGAARFPRREGNRGNNRYPHPLSSASSSSSSSLSLSSSSSAALNFPGSTVYRFVERLQAVKNLQREELSHAETYFASMASAASTVSASSAPSPMLARALRMLAEEAQSTLPQYFFRDDIRELIASKLGVDLREASALSRQMESESSIAFSISPTHRFVLVGLILLAILGLA